MNDKPAGDGAPPNPDAARRDDRDSLFVSARLRPRDRDEMEEVRVRNVSSGGLMAQVARGYAPGMPIEVELEGIGRIVGSVAWSEAGRIGVAFDHPIDKQLARKQAAKPSIDLFRPDADHRRPPIKPR